MIQRIAAKEPPLKVPSPWECGFCPVAQRDCPDRINAPPADEAPEHELF
jgi:hypothetical protein